MYIREIHLIVNTEGATFFSQLKEKINELQDKGYIIEIQYSGIASSFSALVIGRLKPK